jgi:hypothetical protein
VIDASWKKTVKSYIKEEWERVSEEREFDGSVDVTDVIHEFDLKSE